MPEGEAISVTFRPSYWDYLVCGLILQSKPAQISYVILVIGTLLVLPAALAREEGIAALGYVIPALLVILNLPYSIWQRRKLISKDTTVTIKEDMIVNRANLADAESRLTWSMVPKVVRSWGLILIHIRREPVQAAFIPARAFKSPAERSAFYEVTMARWKEGLSSKHADGLCNPPVRPWWRDAPLWANLTALSLLAVMFYPMAVVLSGCLLIVQVWIANPEYEGARAIKAFNAGKPEQALTILAPLLKRGVDSASPYITASAAYVTLGDTARAIEMCSAAIARAPDLSESYNNRGSARLLALQPDEAIEDANSALKLNAGLWNSYIVRANAHMQCYRFEQALESCNEAISINRANSLPYSARGYAHAGLNQLDLALADCEFGVTLARQPATARSRAIALTARAHVLALIGRIDEALRDCTDAVGLDSTSSEALATRACCLCVANRVEEAKSALTEAKLLARAPGAVRRLVAINALIEIMEQKFDAAAQQAREALELRSTPDAQCYLALATAHQGQYRDALAHVNEAITLNAYEAEAFWIRSMIHKKLGDQAAADADRKIWTDCEYKPFLPVLGGAC